MAVIVSGQIQTSLKEILRRTDEEITRAELIQAATLELGVGRGRVEEQLDKLDRKGEVYHVGDGETAEVRVP